MSLNDGIKGFSDEVVESLLPRDLSRDKLETTKEHDAPEHNNENFIDAKSTNTNKGQLLVSSDDHLDSFDRSYNHTEQSILNLLNSASQSQISLNALENKGKHRNKNKHKRQSLKKKLRLVIISKLNKSQRAIWSLSRLPSRKNQFWPRK